MEWNKTEFAPYLTYSNLKQFSVVSHFVTTRHGGVSTGAYASLNIGLGTDDEASAVLQNRKILAKSVNIPLSSFVFLNQVHETRVEVATLATKGSGAFNRESAVSKTDAIITNQSGICLFVMGADCVPVLFFDPVKLVVGACHSGWRGTVKSAPAKTVEKMVSAFGSNPGDVLVGIGPSIGSCCYEVGNEVVSSVREQFGKNASGLLSIPGKGTQFHFDLWGAVEQQLVAFGVRPENIEQSGLCTKCNSGDFFSSRQGRGVTGRFGAGIMLKTDYR
jgi:polyphenol oxidase